MSEQAGLPIRETSFLRDRAYAAVSLTHFSIDVLNSSRTLLIALLAVSLDLTNAQVGLALLLYNIGSALSQPFFGRGADRSGPRWFIIGGLVWLSSLYGLAAIVGDWVALAAITLAGFGSGAFHPSGTKVASESSQSARTQATAVFFFSGQIGLFAGPILAGLLLQQYGRSGYLLLPLLSSVALLSSWLWVSNRSTHTARTADVASTQTTSRREIPWRTVIPLLVIIMTTSTVGIATINFAPKLFTELGYAPAYVGLTAGLYMLGSAVGGLVGGALGDHLGRRPAILIGVLGAIIPLYFYIPAGEPWRFVLLLMAGFFAGMPHSVLVISAQVLLPGQRAFASGLTLGLMFFSGAVGSFIVGVVADQAGLMVALQGLVILLIVAAVGTVLLPKSAPETASTLAS
jgi:FSR family fosmidomycin resistance protein-like MFS transporter